MDHKEAVVNSLIDRAKKSVSSEKQPSADGISNGSETQRAAKTAYTYADRIGGAAKNRSSVSQPSANIA